MNKLMNKVMLSCKKASTLVEKQSTDKLSMKEGFQLNLHSLFCKTCRAYERHSKALDKNLSKWVKSKQNKIVLKLSKEKKSNILKEIKNI